MTLQQVRNNNNDDNNNNDSNLRDASRLKKVTTKTNLSKAYHMMC